MLAQHGTPGTLELACSVEIQCGEFRGEVLEHRGDAARRGWSHQSFETNLDSTSAGRDQSEIALNESSLLESTDLQVVSTKYVEERLDVVEDLLHGNVGRMLVRTRLSPSRSKTRPAGTVQIQTHLNIPIVSNSPPPEGSEGHVQRGDRPLGGPGPIVGGGPLVEKIDQTLDIYSNSYRGRFEGWLALGAPSAG
jgi:hypothetical protein